MLSAYKVQNSEVWSKESKSSELPKPSLSLIVFVLSPYFSCPPASPMCACNSFWKHLTRLEIRAMAAMARVQA